jgi:hypothetical protein
MTKIGVFGHVFNKMVLESTIYGEKVQSTNVSARMYSAPYLKGILAMGFSIPKKSFYVRSTAKTILRTMSCVHFFANFYHFY